MACVSEKQIIIWCIGWVATEVVITTYPTSSIIDYTYYQNWLPTSISWNLTETWFSTDCTASQFDFEFWCYFLKLILNS